MSGTNASTNCQPRSAWKTDKTKQKSSSDVNSRSKTICECKPINDTSSRWHAEQCGPHEGAVACMRSQCEEPLVAVMAAAVAASAAPMRAAVGVADAASRRMDAVR